MHRESGQILIEVIVASLIIIMVSLAVTQVISSSVKGIDVTTVATKASFLAQEVADAANAVSLEDWHNVSNLATSSTNTYYTATSSGKWVFTAGTENVVLNNATYTRSFYITDVYRSTSTGDIVSSGGYYDPSTAKLNIGVSWTDTQGKTASFSQVEYLSRYLNQTYSQTNWSGGTVGEQVTSVATTTFATSTGIDASTTGSIQLLAQ